MAADVSARRAEPRVTQDAHELSPQAGDGDRVQGRAGGAVGVPVARHVGHDHVERVGGVGAVRAGVGQEWDHLRVTPERVRPAVAENQRQNGPGRRGGPDVDEVNPEAGERDAEAWELRERRLLRRPVELVRPVGDELAKVGEVGPERPPGVLGRIRPPRRAQPRPEVLKRRGRGLRRERLGAGRGVRHETQPTGRAALRGEPAQQEPERARASSERAARSAAVSQQRAPVVQSGPRRRRFRVRQRVARSETVRRRRSSDRLPRRSDNTPYEHGHPHGARGLANPSRLHRTRRQGYEPSALSPRIRRRHHGSWSRETEPQPETRRHDRAPARGVRLRPRHGAP